MFLGSLVGALATIALAAPLAHAAGRPADVTVRVEGPRGTLAQAAITTTTDPVVKDGDRSHACSGTSAAGALEQATDGEWSASWFRGLGYAVDAVSGIRGGDPSEYWTVWLNRRASMTGLCDTELQDGDELLVFLCRSGPDFSCVNRPLGLLAPRGRSARPTVRVVAYNDDGSTAPAAGATVSGGARAVRADAQGRATVTLRGDESQLLATRAGDVPSAPVFCSADRCGSRDRTPPLLRVRGIRDGQAFPAARAPRALRGTAVDATATMVELRLQRRVEGRCQAYDGVREVWGTRCPRGGAWWQASDRRSWSYLLPRRLAPGRYVLGALASDAAGNTRRVTVRFRVLAAGDRARAAAARRAAPAAAAASGPRVRTSIRGARGTRMATRTVTASATTVRVGGTRCAVPAGTPLAALLAADRAGGPSVRVADYGSCNRSASNSGGLYVTQIGGERRRGQAGWVYAVDGRAGTAGAADPSGPFGSGRLRSGQRVAWTWCARAGACEAGGR